jgi:hypothetical protein
MSEKKLKDSWKKPIDAARKENFRKADRVVAKTNEPIGILLALSRRGISKKEKEGINAFGEESRAIRGGLQFFYGKQSEVLSL